jgi:DNA-binding beta-propeller fold protein YncE
MNNYARIRIVSLLSLMALAFLVASLSVMAGSAERPVDVVGQDIATDTAARDAATATSLVSGLAYVAMSGSNDVAMIDTASHSSVGLIDVGSNGCFFPWRATMSPDMAYVYVGCYNSDSVVVIETGSNTVATNIGGIPAASEVVFVQNGAYALVGSRWYTQIKVIDTTTYAVINTIVTPGYPRSLTTHPLADMAYAASSNGSILAINTDTFTIEDTITIGGDPWDVIVSPDGQLAFAGDRGGGGLHVIDTATNTLITTITGVGDLTGLSVTPDGQKLFAAGMYSGVRVFDIPSLSYETLISVPGPVWDTAVNCDGSEVYASNTTSTVRAIDAGSYNVVAEIVLGGSTARGIAICPEFALSGVALLPPAQTNAGALGETVVHQLTLYNASDLTDSYDLSLDGYSWDTAVSALQVGPLLPGEQVTFTVAVAIPVAADWYDTDSATVMATSVTSPTVYSDTAVVNTLAYAPPVINVTPDGLEATLLVNEATTTPMSFSNGNGVTLTFELWERERTLAAYGLLESAHAVIAEPEQRRPTAEGLGLPPTPEATLLSAGQVVQSWPSGLSKIWGIAYDGDSDTVWVSSPSSWWGGNSTFYEYLPTGSQTGRAHFYTWSPFDGPADATFNWNTNMLWIMDVGSDNCIHEINPATGVTGNNICPGFSSTQRGLAYDPISDTYFAGSWTDYSVHRFDSAGNILEQVYVGLPISGLAYNPDSEHLFALVNAFNTPVYVLDVANNYTIVGQFAISEGFGSYDGAGLALDCQGHLWAATQSTQMVYKFESGEPTTVCAADLPWLNLTPASGSVPSNSSLPVTVGFDATNIQPGAYLGSIIVDSNDPVNSRWTVPVTMTVEPTASMGWVEGIITDAGTGLPVEATIIAQGQPYTVTSDANSGAYNIWLEAGSYTLQVSAPGYVTATQTVDVTAQAGTTQDFALILNVPVLNVTHESMAVAQDMGQATTRALTITNDGPAPLEFEIRNRDTTPGLQFLAQFARSQDEIDALAARAGANGSNERDMPTIASVPPEAFAHLTGDINILAWTGYTDYYEEYANTLNAIAQYATFSLVETTTEDPVTLGSLLVAADVFLVPEQEMTGYSTMFNMGIAWATVLQNFVTNGGTVVVLEHCGQAYGVLVGSGLMDITFMYCDWNNWLEVVESGHPLVDDVPNPFYGLNGTAFFSATDGETIVQRQGASEISVAAKEMGNGRIALIGFDFYSYNDDMARLLANAVQWIIYEVDWLSATPDAGTVPGYDSLSVEVTFDATSLQPGLYTANLFIDSNDQVTPRHTIPVTMTVSPAAGMGQVTGTVTDLWTVNPLTATVELVGAHTATADPHYTIWAESGVYDLVASASGYMTATYQIMIPPDGVVVQDIALEPAQARLEMGVIGLSETAVPGQVTAQTFVITNSGPLPLEIAFFEVPSTLQEWGQTTADLDGKMILYDRSHGQPDLWYYSIMYNDLVNAGAQILQNFTYPITAEILEPYDILWINCCGWTSWTFSELLALQNWVSDGGAVFIHGSQSPATSGPAQIFDIDYQSGSCTWGTTTDVTPHPISLGVNSVYVDYTCYYLHSTGEALSVVRDLLERHHIMAHQGSGGKLVIVGANDFHDFDIDQDDNRLLANNIMAWLALPAYGDVPWLSVAPETATITGHSSLTVTVTFDATGLEPGQYAADLAIEHNDSAQAFPLMLPVTLDVVEQVAAVLLTPATASGSGAPGESVTYMLTVQNTGNGPDSFTIAVGGNWPAAPSIVTTGEMLPGATLTFNVVVAIPLSTGSGSSDVTSVTVQSQFEPGVSQASSLTTTAELPVHTLYLPVVMKP